MMESLLPSEALTWWERPGGETVSKGIDRMGGISLQTHLLPVLLDHILETGSYM